MSSPVLQPRQRPSSGASLQGDFRVEVMGSQESLDLDCGKFYTVHKLQRLPRGLLLVLTFGICRHRNIFCAARGSSAMGRQRFVPRLSFQVLLLTRLDGVLAQIWDVVRRYREFCAIDILVRPTKLSLSTRACANVRNPCC
jgi:hypothetical protein